MRRKHSVCDQPYRRVSLRFGENPFIQAPEGGIGRVSRVRTCHTSFGDDSLKRDYNTGTVLVT